MELYSTHNGLGSPIHFNDHSNLSEDFRIDIFDILKLNVIYPIFFDHHMYQWATPSENQAILAQISRYIFKNPATDLTIDRNDWEKLLRKLCFSGNGIQLFDAITILLKNNIAIDNIAEVFDKYCLTLRIDKNALRISPRLNNEQQNALNKGLEVVNSSYPSSAAYLNECLNHHQKGEYKDSIEKAIKALESLVRDVMEDQKPTLGKLIGPLIEKFGQESEICLMPIHHIWGSGSNQVRHGNNAHATHNFTSNEAIQVLVTVNNLIWYISEKNKTLASQNLAA